MEKWKNIKIDDETMWPKAGLVKMDKAHIDERGYSILSQFPYEESFTDFLQKRCSSF